MNDHLAMRDTQRQAVSVIIGHIADEALAVTHQTTLATEATSTNEAIGALTGLDKRLERIQGLYCAALAINRSMGGKS